MLSVIRKKPLHILSDVPDDKSSRDEAFEIVKSNVGDKEPDEYIFRQFLQPHVSNSRAIAKSIRKQKSEKGMLKNSLPRSRFDLLPKLSFVPPDKSYFSKRKI